MAEQNCVYWQCLGWPCPPKLHALMSAEVMASSTLRPMGGAGGRVMPPLPFGPGAYKSGGSVEFMHGMMCWTVSAGTSFHIVINAWTVLTDVPPKELRWPLCTGWTLGWCRKLPMPVSVHSYERCPVVLHWCLMPCHTQCIHSQTWNEQWHGTASRVCLCPLPISSELFNLQSKTCYT